MITTDNLPQTYQPYQQLTLCSNRLEGGGHLIKIGDFLPLLIGKGPTPQIWLQAPSDASGKKFAVLINASVPTHPAMSVSTENGALVIYAAGKLVLRVRQQSEDQAEVEELDLRPLGFNIFGDRKSLNAGGVHMSSNSFVGVGTLLAFGN